MKIEVVVVDYSNEKQGKEIFYLLNSYAMDPMGGGSPLSAYAKENLASKLARIPHAFSVICYIDNKAAGLINCFEGFSTFNCKSLINIHDVVVLSDYRGQGISQLMMTKVEEIARKKDCCKITLEVFEGNEAAQKAYIKFGFETYELDPVIGRALFWQKSL